MSVAVWTATGHWTTLASKIRPFNKSQSIHKRFVADCAMMTLSDFFERRIELPTEVHECQSSDEARSVHAHLAKNKNTVAALGKRGDHAGDLDELSDGLWVIGVIPGMISHFDPQRLENPWYALGWFDFLGSADVDRKKWP